MTKYYRYSFKKNNEKIDELIISFRFLNRTDR